MVKDILVLGLGIFGSETAKYLTEMGKAVLAVDKSHKAVNEIKNDVNEAMVADATDPAAMEEIGAGEFDLVVVGMSNSLEAMILAVTNLKKLGVKKIIAKADSVLHAEILLKIGADEVILPDKEVAYKTAEKICNPGIEDMLKIDDSVQLANVTVDEKLDGKSLLELDLRKNYGITVVAVNKNRNKATLVTSPSTIINKGDKLVVAGEEKAILELFSKEK